MTKLYRPSNGSEGMAFMSMWCERCKESDGRHDFGDGCEIHYLTMVYSIGDPDYPPEWVQDEDGSNPRCTAFTPIRVRDNEPPKIEQVPGQMDLFGGKVRPP